jgi:glyoxylase-like metal-dependent hydrolase (beta-lactamase superfamily II)
VTGYVNEQSLLERVETQLPNPAYGDMPVEVRYSDYRAFGGVQFPTRIQVKQGGYPTLDLTVSDVQPNVNVDLPVPETIAQAPTGVRVDSQRVADGVWFLAGGSHNSVAIEFSEYVTVIEAPLNEERSLAVIDEVKRLIPGKPIRYLVNTHHHVDHSGGLRTYVAEGATIVTHQMNQAFYERMFKEARVASADKLSQNPREAMLETFTDRRSLTDGARTLELYHIQGNGHNDGIVMAYLPRERLLIEADVFTPPSPDAPPSKDISVYTQNLDENIQRLRLNVQQILPIHGRIVGMADLRKALGRAG